ncbi:MAG TPA: hypothetical protein VER04_22675 [Polyangiaceae bacterium]|nr:hypothetical protein [Polyangiaceae bacterium]
MKNKSKNKHQPVEGEGSYTAARRYNQHLGDAVASGDLEAGAEEAARALTGPEGAELLRAAEEAKRGPKRPAKGPTTRQTTDRR